jgi:hypothetical protein
MTPEQVDQALQDADAIRTALGWDQSLAFAAEYEATARAQSLEAAQEWTRRKIDAAHDEALRLSLARPGDPPR